MADVLATVFSTYYPELSENDVEAAYEKNKDTITATKEFKRLVEYLEKNNGGKKFSRTDTKLSIRTATLLNTINDEHFDSSLLGYVSCATAALLAVKSKDVKYFINLYVPPEEQPVPVATEPVPIQTKNDANEVLEKIKKLLG